MEDLDTLLRLASVSLQIAREMESQAATQRSAAERLYGQAALMKVKRDRDQSPQPDQTRGA